LSKTVLIRISAKGKRLINCRAVLTGKTQTQVLDEYLGLNYLFFKKRKRGGGGFIE